MAVGIVVVWLLADALIRYVPTAVLVTCVFAMAVIVAARSEGRV